MDRGGNALGPTGTPDGDYVDFRLSPDEKRLAASLVNAKAGTVDIWLTDLARNSSSRFASGGLVTATPLWSPDGSYRLAWAQGANRRLTWSTCGVCCVLESRRGFLR